MGIKFVRFNRRGTCRALATFHRKEIAHHGALKIVRTLMFRRSASLAIPHRKSFAAIPSVSLLLGHTNRNVKLSHESQREIALDRLGTFKTDSLLQQGEVGEENGPVFGRVCVFDVWQAARCELPGDSRESIRRQTPIFITC